MTIFDDFFYFSKGGTPPVFNLESPNLAYSLLFIIADFVKKTPNCLSFKKYI